MQHVVVGSSGDLGEDYLIPSIINNRVAGNGLHSLIDGLKGENIDSEKMGLKANKIEQYHQQVSEPAKAELYIDSGGYSFIKGDLAPHNLFLAIDLYTSFLKERSDDYDYIFSLDIPYSLKFDNFNTKENVYYYNKKSLEYSIDILRKYPELVEKFYLVNHFKTIDHYQIWRQLHTELSLGNYIKYYAIGGMVSIKEIADINIAPFIATAFQCLWDYENSPYNGQDFRIHFLGISVDYDRFLIAFLERLFQRYLGDTIPVSFTYDTIKFKRSAMYRQDHICDFDQGILHAYSPVAIPDHVYQSIYLGYEEIIDLVKLDLARKDTGEKHENQANIAPLVISSELAIDRFFEHQIEFYEMVDIMFNSRNIIYFDSNIQESIKSALKGYHMILGKKIAVSIHESLMHVYKFHRWYKDLHEAKTLDQMSMEFITKDIHFPFRLS